MTRSSYSSINYDVGRGNPMFMWMRQRDLLNKYQEYYYRKRKYFSNLKTKSDKIKRNFIFY